MVISNRINHLVSLAPRVVSPLFRLCMLSIFPLVISCTSTPDFPPPQTLDEYRVYCALGDKTYRDEHCHNDQWPIKQGAWI